MDNIISNKMSEDLYLEAKKMLAFEELTRLMIENSTDQEFQFWKIVKKELDLVTEGLVSNEIEKKLKNNY